MKLWPFQSYLHIFNRTEFGTKVVYYCLDRIVLATASFK